MKKSVFLIALILIASGCSTATYLKLPEDSVLKIKRGTEQPHTEGRLVRTPLSWSSAGGIPYKLEKKGKVIQEGRLRSKFRVSSIFWPPAAILYWPMGFRYSCYDLTGEFASECSMQTLKELKSKQVK